DAGSVRARFQQAGRGDPHPVRQPREPGGDGRGASPATAAPARALPRFARGVCARPLMADGASWIMPRMDSAATDEALIARYAAGDVAAFEALYARHELALWRFVLRLCRDRATAEELMQETWFAVTREAPRFRADGRFAPWLYTIARN